MLLDLIKRKMNLYKNTDPLREPKSKDASGPQEWPGARPVELDRTQEALSPLLTLASLGIYASFFLTTNFFCIPIGKVRKKAGQGGVSFPHI